MGNAEYMGSRPESDVSGGDIMGENEDLMLGEEELSEDDEGQMLEGPLLPGQAPMVIPEVPMPQEVTDGVDGYFCKHYKRKCMFVTPCCNGLYRCRFCHDEAEDHTLTREDVVTVECCDCKVRQGVNENCTNCGLKFGQVVRLRILPFKLVFQFCLSTSQIVVFIPLIQYFRVVRLLFFFFFEILR